MKRVTPLPVDNCYVIAPLSRRSLCRVLAPALGLGLFECSAFPLAAFIPRLSHAVPRLPRVLFLGDSLTVGPFGDRMEEFLVRTVGDSNVYMAAVCGSSPEHWLESEPEFRSRCGYRFKQPRKKTDLGRYQNGIPPETRATRKIEELLPKIRPDVVVVQLGTNWFDRLAESSSESARERIRHITEQFQSVVERKAPDARLIWITPPDSSRFRSVQATVTRVIREVAARRVFWVINSSSMITYVPGKSGGDGVHLAASAAEEWFEKVKIPLHRYLLR